MSKRSNILIAAVLAAVFALFNVGLPFVLYVCPMLAGPQASCTCNEVQAQGLAISYPTGDCCNHTVLAERNTTPFLQTSKYQAMGSEMLLVLPAAVTLSMAPSFSPTFAGNLDTGPPAPAQPIYLLSSSLLI